MKKVFVPLSLSLILVGAAVCWLFLSAQGTPRHGGPACQEDLSSSRGRDDSGSGPSESPPHEESETAGLEAVEDGLATIQTESVLFGTVREISGAERSADRLRDWRASAERAIMDAYWRDQQNRIVTGNLSRGSSEATKMLSLASWRRTIRGCFNSCTGSSVIGNGPRTCVRRSS